MKFKLDENPGLSSRRTLEHEHHDVSTVVEQKLQAAVDEHLAKVCFTEDRVLVTLDLDFANTLRFPPEATRGIAVLRPPGKVSESVVVALTRTLALAVQTMEIKGKLWVVEPGRIRVHEGDQ